MPNKRSAADVAQLHKDRDRAQQARAQANFLIRKMSQRDVENIQARLVHETYAQIGRDLGFDEFTIARAAKYGKLSPWQAAEQARNERRKPLQEAWAKKNKQDKLAAS